MYKSAQYLAAADLKGSIERVDYDDAHTAEEGAHTRLHAGIDAFDGPLRSAIQHFHMLEPDQQLILESRVNVDALPAPIRNRIRLHLEVTGQDAGQAQFVTPFASEPTMPVVDSRRQEEKKKKERWELFLLLLMMQMYNENFAKTWIMILEIRQELDMMIDDIKEVELEHSGDFNLIGSGLKVRMQKYRDTTLQNYEDRMRFGRPPPSMREMRHMREEMSESTDNYQQLMQKFMSAPTRAIDAIKKVDISNTMRRIAAGPSQAIQKGWSKTEEAVESVTEWARDLVD